MKTAHAEMERRLDSFQNLLEVELPKHFEAIKQSVEALPRAIADVILKNFSINGATPPVTRGVLEEVILRATAKQAQATRKLTELLQTALSRRPSIAPQVPIPDVDDGSHPSVAADAGPWWKSWSYGGHCDRAMPESLFNGFSIKYGNPNE